MQNLKGNTWDMWLESVVFNVGQAYWKTWDFHPHDCSGCCVQQNIIQVEGWS